MLLIRLFTGPSESNSEYQQKIEQIKDVLEKVTFNRNESVATMAEGLLEVYCRDKNEEFNVFE